MTAYLKIHDKRINADNYLFQMPIKEYFELMKDSLFNNEYQRRRVQNSTSIYALLRSDLVRGCIMPPIVLATESKIDDNVNIISQIKNMNTPPIILDGLQRSLTICDLYRSSEVNLTALNNTTVRIELYTGISRIGLLYRMLTLNTGQTRMSTRHQIEIIYSDYKDNCNIEGIKFITQNDNDYPSKLGEYNFKDVVDGFTSYIQKDYLILDRSDILESIRDLERLSTMDSDKDLFNSFISSYNNFVIHLNELIPQDLSHEIAYLTLDKTPFGTSIVNIFNKSQAMTGFGNAIASLTELGVIKGFKELEELTNKIKPNSVKVGLLKMLKDLDNVRKYAKKIGNDQRLYFNYFFRALFDEERSDVDIQKASELAFHNYERDVL